METATLQPVTARASDSANLTNIFRRYKFCIHVYVAYAPMRVCPQAAFMPLIV